MPCAHRANSLLARAEGFSSFSKDMGFLSMSFSKDSCSCLAFPKALFCLSGATRHVHLAVSHRPEAGLREGSDIILVIDLMRAHNAGCVFYVSDNNVVLTADCIPPPCIVRATCASTGAAYDLSQFRAAYMVVCAASSLPTVVGLGFSHSAPWSVTGARFALSSYCRCSLRSTSEPPCHPRQASSRHLGARVRQASTSCCLVDKAAAPIPLTAVSGWGARPLRTLCHTLDLLAAYRLPLVSAVHLLLTQSFSRLRLAMQRGTPLGHERRYSWKATAGRSEAPYLRHKRLSCCKYKSLFSTENFRILMMRKFRLSVLGKL